MDETISSNNENQAMIEYKFLETRLYGELLKACRRYSNKLTIISIVGIIDLVKQEITDLEKENLKFMKDDIPNE